MIYPDNFENKIGFDRVRQRVSELCSAPGAVGRARDMAFSTDYKYVYSALCAVSEMCSLLQSEAQLPTYDCGNADQTIMSIKVPGTSCSSADMLGISKALRCIDETSACFRAMRNEDGVSRFPVLDGIAGELQEFGMCRSAIDRIMDRFGNVKDSASAELGQIRRSLNSMSGSVNSTLRRVMARAVAEGILEADASPAMRDGRLVLPVAPMNKRRLSGIVHDESASGKTVYIEPAEVVEANNRIRELQLEEKREILRILAELATFIRPYIPDIAASIDILAHIDFIRAKAVYAGEVGGMLPNIADKPELEWYHACHPVLLKSLQSQGREIVPLDITLSPEKRILIISGPNAGGKSVCLKTVGIIQYMTQCGLLPPVYENSHIGIFNDIFVDIGDNQSIEDDLSTYSSHLRNMKLFVAKGKSGSLVLIDEFGGGTEPQIGGAIAQAILHKFADSNLWGVITTHYQNLKHFAEDTAGLVNGSMLYDRHLMQPLFKLSIGNPGSSFAIEIARKTGLPADIIAEAESIVGSDYVNLDKYLLDIARDRKYWENKRSEIKKREKKLEEVIARYENDAETLRLKRREIIDEAKTEAERILSSSNASIERTIREIRTAQANRERTLEARSKLEEEKRKLKETADTDAHPLLKKAPKAKKQKPTAIESQPARTLQVGDIVKLDGAGSPGKILELDGKNAVVAFGLLKTSVKTDRLKLTNAQLPASGQSVSFISSNSSDASRDRQLNFSSDIDVRGMRVDEAIQAITYFIDDAVQFSAERVRILHGTGTGALRQAIRQYLDTVREVRAYRDEHVQFGGAGITVVDLS
ncbi:MAG: endonuclease MutS2 [Muribaculaceae bacterium]|nr:endonuclease MutS2 [Muribaculaceae bacterium]